MDHEIYLELGDLVLDRHRDRYLHLDYSALFQPPDAFARKYWWSDELPGDLPEEITQVSQAYRRSLRSIVPRLDLLGYSLNQVEKMYEDERQRRAEDSTPRVKMPPYPPFAALSAAFSEVTIDSASSDVASNDGRPIWNEVAAKVIASSAELPSVEGRLTVQDWYEFVAGGLEPFELLQLLAQNPANADLPVTWHPFNEVLHNFAPDDQVNSTGANRGQRFLIVTEGSSDTAVIQNAIASLKPYVADFFDFIDMERNYPLTGAGNLHNFYQGLLKIGILNNILFVYDNDAVGSSKYEAASRLPAPANIRTMKLPDLPSFEDFSTIGPTGESAANINGRAASIECYLDMTWQAGRLPRVRWTSFQPDTGLYQGELEDKQAYVRRFLSLSEPDLLSYDVTRLEALLDQILFECAAMAQELLDEEWHAN